MKYSTNELLIAGMRIPRIIDLFYKDIQNKIIDLHEIIEDKNMILSTGSYYSEEELDLLLNTLDLSNPIRLRLCDKMDAICKNRSNILQKIGLEDYCSRHYTSLESDLECEIIDYNKLLRKKSSLLSPERIRELNFNPQNTLNEMEVVINKLRNTFKKKDLNKLIEKTMKQQKCLFMTPTGFYFNLIGFIELGSV